MSTPSASPPGSSDFVVGVDLGQAQDYTALAVGELVGADLLHFRHMERLPLGLPYPEAVERIVALVRALPGNTQTSLARTRRRVA